MSQTFASRYSPQEISASLQGTIPPIRLAAFYRIGLGIVAVVMVLLPVIYFAMIAGVAYGVYYHAANHTGIVSGLWSLVIYLAPIVAGGLLIFFMFKPLFAARPPAFEERWLNPKEAPLLFAFVSRVCQTIGAPAPQEIHINLAVNASAAFCRGFWSFLDNDLNLTIGLPLITSLPLQQFGGILAHEFGHFAQGTAMRFTYIIRSLNHWFARVVFERDAWDLKLAAYSEQLDVRLGIMLLLARGAIWLSRKMLFGLMWLGNVVSAFMLRQMEFDADRYEIELSGSANFISTVHQLRKLQAASQMVLAEIAEAWHEKRLPQNMATLVNAKIAHFPEPVQTALNNSLATEKTGLFDSHPCDRDRIENAEKINAAGIFRSELPAAILLNNVETLAQELSKEYYKGVLGSAFREEAIVATTEMMQRQATLNLEQEAATRYFAGMLLAWRPEGLGNADIHHGQSAEELIAELRETRAVITRERDRFLKTFAQYAAARNERDKYLQFVALLQIEAKVKLEINTLDEAETKLHEIDQQLKSLAGWRDEFNHLYQKRLRAGLQLLHTPDFAAAIPEATALQAEIGKLLPVVRIYDEQKEGMKQMGDDILVLQTLANFWEAARDKEFADRKAGRILPPLQKNLLNVHQAFAAIEYPFEHKERLMSVAAFLLESPAPQTVEFTTVYPACLEFFEKAAPLYYRLIGRLAVIVERIEKAAGFSPIAVETNRPETTLKPG